MRRIIKLTPIVPFAVTVIFSPINAPRPVSILSHAKRGLAEACRRFILTERGSGILSGNQIYKVMRFQVART